MVKFPSIVYTWCMWWHSWLSCCDSSQKVVNSISDEVIGFFKFTKSFQLHSGPGVDSASNRSEYQHFSWAVKSSWHIRLMASPSCVSWLSRKYGASKSHNHMDLHGLLQGELYLYIFVYSFCNLFLNSPICHLLTFWEFKTLHFILWLLHFVFSVSRDLQCVFITMLYMFKLVFHPKYLHTVTNFIISLSSF
jgi:hypothetical protein